MALNQFFCRLLGSVVLEVHLFRLNKLFLTYINEHDWIIFKGIFGLEQAASLFDLHRLKFGRRCEDGRIKSYPSLVSGH